MGSSAIPVASRELLHVHQPWGWLSKAQGREQQGLLGPRPPKSGFRVWDLGFRV